MKIFFLLLTLIVVIFGFYGQTNALTRFGEFSSEKKLPAEINFDDIWFESGETRIIPEVSMTWLTVVFDPRYTNVNLYNNEAGGTYESFIQEKAKTLITSHSDLIDFLYDKNLAEDACFFRLREKITAGGLKQLIAQLNQDEAINYTQPTIILENKTYAFFNALQIKWKAGADTARKDSLVQQARVEFDMQENIYRAHVLESPFFTAFHLLAEDIRVRETTPYLVEIKPTIRTSLALAMNGAHIGDSIPFSFTIVFSDRVLIDPSSISTLNLRPFNLQKDLFDCTFAPYDPTKVAMKSPIIITGTITCYAAGEFVIPPMAISYTCQTCSGVPVRTVDTKQVPIKISSLVPAASEESRLLVPADVIQPDYHFEALRKKTRCFFAATVTAFLLFFVCAVWCCVLIYREKKESGKLIERTRDDILAEKLRLVLISVPPSPHWKFLAEVGTLVRQYIAARYQISLDHFGGSGKQFVNLIGNHIPENFTEPLRAILATIDNAVAREVVSYLDIENFLSTMTKFMDLTARHNDYTIKNKP